MNIGAESITDYGDYFAWGETTPHQADADGKIYYDLEHYKWYTSETTTDQDGFESTVFKYTKYCTDESYGPVDNITTLELADDAAHVNWGGAWRMPTYDDFRELLNNCTWQWATLNGVNGYKVSSKAEGNTNYIFLPVTGYYDQSYLSTAGSYGYYWSSSLSSSDASGAWGLYFYAGNHSTSYYNGRYYGLSVRPVCFSKKQEIE